MFLEVDRNDQNAVLEIGKLADIIIVMMSCAETEIEGLKMNPEQHSHAIDETGYKALALLRC